MRKNGLLFLTVILCAVAAALMAVSNISQNSSADHSGPEHTAGKEDEKETGTATDNNREAPADLVKRTPLTL